MKRIINLGAGVGSTTVFMLAHLGMIEPVDCAIFADTQEEPKAVYEHLQWLIGLGTIPILVRTRGKLGDDLARGVHASGNPRTKGRFASIPAFTARHHDDREILDGCQTGMTQRQCTNDYKIDVIIQTIRRELFGLKPRQRFPKDVRVSQLFGLDDGEAGRIRRVRESHTKNISWSVPLFPLASLGWAREECLAFLAKHVPHPVPRSACVFCPYHSDTEWKRIRDTDPEGWARAVEIDAAIRDPQSRCNQGLKDSLYLHRKCIPLPMVDIDAGAAAEARRGKQPNLFGLMCEGMCGV